MNKLNAMIDLDKHYGTMDARELVEVIESPEKHKPEVIEYCKKRIRKDTLKSYAREIIKKRFYQYFTNGNYRSNSPIIMDSFYLEVGDVKSCFNESKNEYIKYIEGATMNLPSGIKYLAQPFEFATLRSPQPLFEAVSFLVHLIIYHFWKAWKRINQNTDNQKSLIP